MCEDKPAEAVEDEEIAMNRWVKLQTDDTDSGFVHRFTKLQELWTTMSSSNNSIETYVANIRTKSQDLKRMGAPIDSWILVALLLNNLDGKYKDFVHCLVTQLNDLPDFGKIVTLLHEKDRLLKRDNEEQAMATAMRRYQKEQEEKKIVKGNNNQGRGGRPSGRGRGGNNNGNDRPSKNPNSPTTRSMAMHPIVQSASHNQTVARRDTGHMILGLSMKIEHRRDMETTITTTQPPNPKQMQLPLSGLTTLWTIFT